MKGTLAFTFIFVPVYTRVCFCAITNRIDFLFYSLLYERKKWTFFPAIVILHLEGVKETRKDLESRQTMCKRAKKLVICRETVQEKFPTLHRSKLKHPELLPQIFSSNLPHDIMCNFNFLATVEQLIFITPLGVTEYTHSIK